MTTGVITEPVFGDLPPLIPHAEPKVGYAPNAVVDAFAKTLSNDFLLCRELGHLWRSWSVGELHDAVEEGRTIGWYRTLRCNRCKTKREQHIDDRGFVYSNVYTHPEGYLLEGMGRIVGEGRGLLRLESIRRITGED